MNTDIRAAIINNIFWFVASLTVALMVWFIAKIEANPIDQRVFNRAISIVVDDSMIITETSSTTARVVVNAQQSTLAILQPDDITVTADLRDRPAGTYTIPLEVDISRPASSDTQPTQITVVIEPLISQQVPVELTVIPPPINYAAGLPERDVFQAVVTGSSADVSAVAQVIGEFNLANQQTAAVVERTITLIAEDSEGRRVDDVVIEPETMLVTIPVTQREDVRTFTVRPNIDFNTLPENFEFRDVDYEPNVVIINGNPDVLNTMGDTINTTPISLENRQGDFSVDVGLDLPDDSSLIILNESSTISVDIFISEEDTTLPLENVSIRLIGIADDDRISASVNPLNISVVLNGPLSVIDAIEADSVRAIIDISGLEPGTYTLPPQIEVSQGSLNLSSSNITLIPAEVTVTIAEMTDATPEATESVDD
ncbi:MAG: CdaR family protein [Anaerolineae bacterium]